MQEVFDEIRSALHTVWNRRWVALGVAWVICVLGWLAIAFIPLLTGVGPFKTLTPLESLSLRGFLRLFFRCVAILSQRARMF